MSWTTAPEPNGLVATYFGDPTNVSVTWNPSPGPVTGYTVERYIPLFDETETFDFSGDVTSFTDSLPDYAVDPDFSPTLYSVQAHYGNLQSGGNSPQPPLSKAILRGTVPFRSNKSRGA